MHTSNDHTDWLNKELWKAYGSAKAGKTKKPQVVEFAKNAKSEIWALTREIHCRSYTPRPSTAFILAVSAIGLTELGYVDSWISAKNLTFYKHLCYNGSIPKDIIIQRARY